MLVGDFILVRPTDRHDMKWFKVCVHQVTATSVSLKFHFDFSAHRGSRVNVRFVLNRLPLRRMHMANSQSKAEMSRLLFPDASHLLGHRVTAVQMNLLIPFNRPVCSNPEQLLAVTTILHQPLGSPPFVIFGPWVLSDNLFVRSLTCNFKVPALGSRLQYVQFRKINDGQLICHI